MTLEQRLGCLVEEQHPAVVITEQQRGVEHLEQGLELLSDAGGTARAFGVGGSQALAVGSPGFADAHQVGAEPAQPAFRRIVLAGIRVGHQPRQLNLEMT